MWFPPHCFWHYCIRFYAWTLRTRNPKSEEQRRGLFVILEHRTGDGKFPHTCSRNINFLSTGHAPVFHRSYPHSPQVSPQDKLWKSLLFPAFFGKLRKNLHSILHSCGDFRLTEHPVIHFSTFLGRQKHSRPSCAPQANSRPAAPAKSSRQSPNGALPTNFTHTAFLRRTPGGPRRFLCGEHPPGQCPPP